MSDLNTPLKATVKMYWKKANNEWPILKNSRYISYLQQKSANISFSNHLSWSKEQKQLCSNNQGHNLDMVIARYCLHEFIWSANKI